MQSISTIGLDLPALARKKHMAVFVERRHFHGHALRCRGLAACGTCTTGG
jgi:hypothetical protein